MKLNEYQFSPSELDFKAKKCKRCFYISKHYKINPGDRPPPVFSTFDSVQKPYFKNIFTSEWTSLLPRGKIMDEKEMPGKIVSDGLVDNKNRKFKLTGNPDIVIKFEEKGYGIIDFKTTTISEDKAEKYRFQLEAYELIFKNPGATKKSPTPKLEPITHMGILQFCPTKITAHTMEDCDIKLQLSYVPLERKEGLFMEHITNLIDLLEQDKVPDFDLQCNFCKFTKEQINLKT